MFTRLVINLMVILMTLGGLAACLPNQTIVETHVVTVGQPVGTENGGGENPVADGQAACTAAGGEYRSTIGYGGGEFFTCVWPDGSVCLVDDLVNGTCIPSTAKPTKDQTPPETPPGPKEADPYPDWATYLNADYSLGMRYPATWLVDEAQNQVRFSQPGYELVVFFRRTDEAVRFSGDLPYEGESTGGNTISIMGSQVMARRLVSDGKLAAVTWGEPEFLAGETVFFVRLLSLRSENFIPEELVMEVEKMLGSLEPWTNHP